MRPEQRAARLEAALIEIAEIAELSDGPVAKFYGMLARRALENNPETSHFPLYNEGQMSDCRCKGNEARHTGE